VRKKSTQKRAVFEDMPVGASRRALHLGATANQEMPIFIGRGVPFYDFARHCGRAPENAASSRYQPHLTLPVVDRTARIAGRCAKTNINQATP